MPVSGIKTRENTLGNKKWTKKSRERIPAAAWLA
jgi:hypothetical protein